MSINFDRDLKKTKNKRNKSIGIITRILSYAFSDLEGSSHLVLHMTNIRDLYFPR